MPRRMQRQRNKGDVPKRLLTVDELADWLQVPKGTVYAWRTLPDPIPAIKVGKYIRFIRAEVVEWLQRRNT